MMEGMSKYAVLTSSHPHLQHHHGVVVSWGALDAGAIWPLPRWQLRCNAPAAREKVYRGGGGKVTRARVHWLLVSKFDQKVESEHILYYSPLFERRNTTPLFSLWVAFWRVITKAGGFWLEKLGFRLPTCRVSDSRERPRIRVTLWLPRKRS